MEEPTLGSLEWACHEAGNLSHRQILRMADEGKFPQPVRVTEGNERHRGRIAFVRNEVRTWVAERIAERDDASSDRAPDSSLAQIGGAATMPEIPHPPQEVNSKGLQKAERHRSRSRPSPRPPPTPNSRALAPTKGPADVWRLVRSASPTCR
jgi:predicted DNA-binding transcriptional regulator AlpA